MQNSINKINEKLLRKLKVGGGSFYSIFFHPLCSSLSFLPAPQTPTPSLCLPLLCAHHSQTLAPRSSEREWDGNGDPKGANNAKSDAKPSLRLDTLRSGPRQGGKRSTAWTVTSHVCCRQLSAVAAPTWEKGESVSRSGIATTKAAGRWFGSRLVVVDRLGRRRRMKQQREKKKQNPAATTQTRNPKPLLEPFSPYLRVL